MIYSLDDKESQGLLTIWKNSALTQLGDHIPQEASAFFDLIKRIPKMFMKHHVFAIGVANEYIQSQRVKTEKSLNAISSRDCISPYLQREQLDLYISFVGLDRVIVEINYAYCEGLVIGKPALNLAENWINQCPDDWVEGINRTLYPLSKPLMLNPTVDKVPAKVDKVEPKTVISLPIEPEIVEDVKPFEEVLLKNLPPVQQVNITKPVEPDVRIQNPIVAASTFTDAPKVDAAESLWKIVDRNNSFFIVGSKGSGKGMCAANFLRRKLEEFPNSIALVLDPKGDAKESGYWKHPQIKVSSFIGMTLDSQGWEEEIIDFLALARHTISQADIEQGKRVWIVFDEFLGLKTNLSKPIFEEVKRLCSNNISMGDSMGVHAIAITQSFNAGDSLDSDELLKNLCMVGLFREDEFARAKKIVNYGKTNTDTFSPGEFSSLMEKSPVRRVICVGGQFMPAPELINYSGFNRDAGTKTGSTEVTLEVYLTKVLSDAQNSGRDINQAYNYIKSIMEHKYITELGLSRSEVEAEIKRLIPKVLKVEV